MHPQKVDHLTRAVKKRLLQIRMYWSKETRVPCKADVASINCLGKIKQLFHCNDNGKKLPVTRKDYDKLYSMPCCQLFAREMPENTSRNTTRWTSKSVRPKSRQV